MPVYKKPEPIKFTPESPVEMHFHDSDETWIMMGGKAISVNPKTNYGNRQTGLRG